jgi:hydroxyacylglutathione hydrolase
MQDDQPVKPANILNIVATNQGKRPLTPGIPISKPLTPAQVEAEMSKGTAVIDTRSSAEFGAGHIKGSFNVQMESSEFEQRIGWVVEDDTPLLLITNTDEEAQQCIYNMAFIALDSFVVGHLDGGIEAWIASGKPLATIPQMDVHTLHHKLSVNGLQVLDVRERDEWDEGHIEGAHFMTYTSMARQIDIPPQIDKLAVGLDQALAVTCATGKRSSTAVSLLRRHGYKNLYNVTGGMEAWENAGFKMIDGEGQVCNI